VLKCRYKKYIFTSRERAMADVAKIFKSGGSQAVRIPAKYRFNEGDEVYVYREGTRLILEARRRSWSEAFRDLAGSAPDFPEPHEPPAVEPGPELD
jgi:antitoxin VapB